MPEKASARSAWVAAGPASWTRVPATPPAARSTRSSTPVSRSPREGSRGTTPSRAAPSFEGRATDGRPTTPAVSASEARARVAAPCWAEVILAPSGAVQTTTAGIVSRSANAFCAAMTLVDSAPRGRKEAWSLVATSPSRPA